MEEKKQQLDLNESKYIYFGLFIVFSILGVLVFWALTAKIDTVVVAQGKVTIKSYKKPVQHKDWGTVTQIYVHEGDYVKKGETLIELEKIEQSANLEISKSEYYSLLAQRDRLISEKRGYNKIIFSKEFLSLDDENLKRELINSQNDLFNKRVSTLRSELSVLEEKKRQLEEEIKGLKELRQLKYSLMKQYLRRLKRVRELVNLGLESIEKQNELEEKIKYTEAEIKDIDNRINQDHLQIVEIEKQKNLKIKEYKQDVSSNLEKVLAQLSQVKPKFKLSKEKIKKSLIKAPISGQVIGLKIFSKGQVVQPGDILMYIVPKKDELFIQVKIDPKDRDKVRENQFVDLHFPSFVSIGANIVEGKVIYVAKDTLFDENMKQEYYESHIQITKKGWEQLKKYNFEIIPGMPVVAYIKVEKITPFEYIMQPILIMIKSAFTSN